MSGIFAMSHLAFANIGDLSTPTEIHIQHADTALCADFCEMNSGLSCAQHCDHQNVIPINLPRILHVYLTSEYHSDYVEFLPMPALLVELKPPQIVL